jgi:hypothetical protein
MDERSDNFFNTVYDYLTNFSRENVPLSWYKQHQTTPTFVTGILETTRQTVQENNEVFSTAN